MGMFPQRHALVTQGSVRLCAKQHTRSQLLQSAINSGLLEAYNSRWLQLTPSRVTLVLPLPYYSLPPLITHKWEQ